MLEQVYPLFQRGRIMKKEMLEAIRNYAYGFDQERYRSYSDGLLWGLDLKVKESRLLLSPGILKYEGKLYLSAQEESIAYDALGRTCILSIEFVPTHETEDFIYDKTRLILGGEVPQRGLELCRFKLKTGARLRSDYVDLEDMATEYDTINLIHSVHAAPEKSTLHPAITRRYAREALGYVKEDPWDIQFCMMALQSREALSREVIEAYLFRQTGLAEKEADNSALYYHLKLRLQALKTGKQKSTEAAGSGRRMLLMD